MKLVIDIVNKTLTHDFHLSTNNEYFHKILSCSCILFRKSIHTDWCCYLKPEKNACFIWVANVLWPIWFIRWSPLGIAIATNPRWWKIKSSICFHGRLTCYPLSHNASPTWEGIKQTFILLAIKGSSAKVILIIWLGSEEALLARYKTQWENCEIFFIGLMM